MALEIASSASWNSNAAAVTSLPITLPSGIQSGDLLLMFLGVDSSTDRLTNTGWTRLATSFDNSEYKYLLGRIADGTEGSTVSFTLSGAEPAGANTYRITGARNGLTTSEIAIAGPVEVTTNTASADPPSLTPSWGAAENLWFAICIINDSAIGAVTAYPTNYDLGQYSNINGSGGGLGAVLSAARLLNAATEDPSAFTWTTGRRGTAYTLAVRPAESKAFPFTPNPLLPFLVR